MRPNIVYIFGYGSLIFAEGINGRGLKKTYKERDLIVTRLNGYRREWNALDTDGWTYLGLVEDPVASVNGVLFPLETDLADIRNFDTSEAVHTLYELVDVADLVEAFPGSIVLTDVIKHPSYGGTKSTRNTGRSSKRVFKSGALSSGRSFSERLILKAK
jgi:hypothetical protein